MLKESIASFVADWGYVAVFLGSLIEGESVILTAGYFAHEGLLSLPKIILISFLGTLVADQGLFHLGRHYGARIIDRFPALRPNADKAFRLLHRYDTLYILSFRFIWGIRIISPVIIGASGVSVKRFSLLNLPAAIIWSVLSCCAGYFFGHLLGNFDGIQRNVAIGLVVIGGLGFFLWKKLKKS